MAAGHRNPGTLTVLAVDDHAVNREFLRAVLESRVGALMLAERGSDAVDRCRRERFDVVLMDLHMPDMDGIIAWQRIRAEIGDERRPRVIALTADCRPEERERLRTAGFDGYVTKPAAPDTLLDMIDRVVAGEDGFAEPVTAPTAGAALLDDARGLATAGGRANLDRMRAAMRSTMDDDLAELDSALAARRFDAAADGLHRWRGACGYCGANRLEQVCARLERSLRGGPHSSPGALYVEFRRVLEATRQLMAG